MCTCTVTLSDNIDITMRTTLLLLLLAAVVGVVLSSPAKGSTKASLKKKPCMKECPDDITPVCAGDGTGKGNRSFANECVLSNHNCEHDTNLQIVSPGECPGGGGIRLQ